jgi:hypothetical protein
MSVEKATTTDGLADYSGPFNPKLKYADFSKEQLLKLMDAWWRIAMQEDVWYHRIIAEEVNEDVAKECNTQMWVKIAPQEIGFMRQALGITGNDVESFWKVMQNDIGFSQGLFELDFDLKNPNHGILTIKTCRGYDYYSRKRGEDFCNNWLCKDLETKAFGAYTAAFNPKIKVTDLKLPPRKTPNEPICQWEFKLEE